VVTEPTLDGAIVDEFFDVIGAPLGELLDAGYERRVRLNQLRQVMQNNSDIYPVIREGFHDQGRFIRTVGNHDLELLHSEFRDELRTAYPDIVANEYVLIVPVDATGDEGYPSVAIAHGHQFDAWTNPTCGPMAGEVITESFSWASEGADRTWSYEDDSAPLLDGSSVVGGNGFENQLVGTGSGMISFGPGMKPRHVDEVELNAERQPRLILGHTHEPRDMAHDEDATVWQRYANTASAGRYEGLVWCVEIEDGVPGLHAWRWTEDGTAAEKARMVLANDGTLVPENWMRG